MDLLQATNTPEPLSLGGETFAVRTLTFREWAAFQAWLMRAVPGPLARAAAALEQLRDSGPANPATEELLLDHAHRASLYWPPRVGSREWLEAVDHTPEGLAKLLEMVLSLTNQGIDPKRAQALAARMTTSEAEQLLDLAVYGIRSGPKDAAAAGADQAPAAAAPTSMNGDR